MLRKWRNTKTKLIIFIIRSAHKSTIATCKKSFLQRCTKYNTIFCWIDMVLRDFHYWRMRKILIQIVILSFVKKTMQAWRGDIVITTLETSQLDWPHQIIWPFGFWERFPSRLFCQDIWKVHSTCHDGNEYNT